MVLERLAPLDREHRAPPRPSPAVSRAVTVVAAVAVPLVLGAAVAVGAKPASIALAGIAAIVSFAGALAFPRWALVATLFLLVGYVPDVLGGSAHKFASAALPLMLVVAVVVRHVSGLERVTVPTDFKWFVYFAVALLIVTGTADHRNLSEFSDFVGFALLAGVMLVVVDSQVWLRRAMWAVVVGAAMLACISVGQQVIKAYSHTFGGFALITPDKSGPRSGGPLSPDYFAEMLVAAGALAWYLTISARSAIRRLTGFGAATVMLVAVYYTTSRGALIAIVAATIAAAILRKVSVSKIVVAAAVVMIGGLLLLPSALQHRIGDLATLRSGGGTSDTSLRGRVAENLSALHMFRDHVILGVGPDNFERHYLAYAQRIDLDPRAQVRGAHSLYLESLAELGIVGSVPFFALLWMGLRRSWQARFGTGRDVGLLAEGCLIAWLAFLVSAIALHLSYPRYLYIFLALALTAGQLRVRRPA
jgi:O-antigen ligase